MIFFVDFVTLASNNTAINNCLSLLKDQVKNQYNVDLSDVNINWNDTNLSIYTGMYMPWSTDGKKTMSEVLVENPNTEWCEYALWLDSSDCEDNYSHTFFAKRNNIWTVKITPEKRWKGYWTATEFVTWWWDIGFQFPLQKRDDPQYDDYTYYNEWDDWWKLQKNVVYAQYLIDWTLLSCGFISFDAESWYTLNDLYQSNYLWNKFEWGSFESLWKLWTDDKYFGMKVRIQWLDWNEKNLFHMNVLAISYDNGSKYFNETIAHQLQIKAMLDVNSMDGDKSMNNVMEKYRNYLMNNTCFKLIHKDKSDLPGFCGWNYSDNSNLVSYNEWWVKKIFAKLFLNNVYAFNLREEDKKKADKKLDNLPEPTIHWVSYSLMRKIYKLKNEELKNKILMALTPWYRAIIKYKIKNWKYVSNDERVFLKSSLNHDDIVKNIEYIFKKYYKNNNLDLSDVEYLNPEFWDDVIPFVDKRHKDKLIENSFLKNKLEFIKRKFGKQKVKEYENKISSITNKYESKIDELNNKYNELITINKKQEAEKISKKLEQLYKEEEQDLNNIAKNDKDFKSYIQTKKKVFKNVNTSVLQNHDKKGNLSVILMVLWIVLILASMFLLYQKNKNAN